MAFAANQLNFSISSPNKRRTSVSYKRLTYLHPYLPHAFPAGMSQPATTESKGETYKRPHATEES